MVMEGADVAQLRTVARQLTVGAEKLEDAAKSVHSTVIGNAQWRGADADRFRSEWNGVSARALSGAAELLKNLSKELRRNADEQESASSYGPHGAAELLSHVENDRVDDQGNELESKESGDGLRIERVLGPDGQTRAIVYFKGQDSVDQRSFGRSAGLAAGAVGVDDALVRKINEELAKFPRGKDTEVMLVGLSQGGMDAQNIANSGKFNVTNLVTYGSPVIQADDPKINTVHIRAEGDPVPAAGEAVAAAARTATHPLSAVLPKQALPLVYAAEVLAPRSDHVFTHDSPNDGQGMQVHERGYPDAAASFDQSNDARFTDVKESIKKFEGTVTVVTE